MFHCSHTQPQSNIDINSFKSLNVGESELHAGSVIERGQNAILYEHSIKVRLNATEFLETPTILNSILENINDINVTLTILANKFHGNFSNATLFQLFQTLDVINDKVIIAQSWFGSKEPRTKRSAGIIFASLLNLVGLGTSIASHIRISNAWSHIQMNTDNIQELQWITARNRDKLNELIDDFNIVQSTLSTQANALTNLYQSLILFIRLNRIHSKLDDFIAFTKSNINTIISVSKGTVTPALITTNQLRAIFASVKILGFTPVFGDNDINFYYSILSTAIDSQYIYVEVPVASSNSHYLHYIVHPFPTYFENHLISLNINFKHLLISNLSTSYITTSDLDNCNYSPTLMVCPISSFIVRFDWEGNCPLHLIGNRSTKVCTFQAMNPNDLADPMVLIAGFKIYLSNVRPIWTDVVCDNTRKERRRITRGVFSFDTSCNVISSNWSINAVRNFLQPMERVRIHFKDEAFSYLPQDMEFIGKSISHLPSIMTSPVSHSDLMVYVIVIVTSILMLFALTLVLCKCHRCQRHLPVTVAPIKQSSVAPRQPFRLIFN